jgi:single-strand DNA-binding protein
LQWCIIRDFFILFLIIHFNIYFMLKLFVIGNLGKDAIVNQVGNNSVINFSVAHTERYKDKNGQQQQKTTWVDAAWWTDKHAIVPYLTKGTQVFLEGVPEVKTFSKQDGTTGTSLVLRVGACTLIGGNNNNNSNAQVTTAAPQTNNDFSSQAPAAVDDLPF